MPSIIYGILGLGLIGALGFTEKNIVLGGALTLALLILPVVIIATREAMRAVPAGDPVRLAGPGRHQVADHLAPGAAGRHPRDRHRVDPGAVAGHRRGGAAAAARRVVFIPFDPNGLLSDFTTLPIQIFNWTSAPQEEFQDLAAATSIVLLAILLGDERHGHLHPQQLPEALVRGERPDPGTTGDPMPSPARPLDAPRAEQATTGRSSTSDRDLNVFYGDYEAVRGVDMPIGRNEITALIGPSGCGKSTVLRCLNRMNDLVPGARVEGTITYHGEDLYGPDVDPIEVRRRVGMVFQKPNPFPKSIYDNIAYGPRVNGGS